uniref:Cyclin N-terminal domain-containing protein n=1 Tax=Ananas comosus var. bracteatus TaxID=296719 RepID=A0A6V7Q3Z7_ANACO|nr:unnamed protein product [Ananas comosus var. bracteatus]
MVDSNANNNNTTTTTTTTITHPKKPQETPGTLRPRHRRRRRRRRGLLLRWPETSRSSPSRRTATSSSSSPGNAPSTPPPPPPPPTAAAPPPPGSPPRAPPLSIGFSDAPPLRLRPCTAFVAAAYFDRFLRQENIDERPQWALDLLKVACVSLAAKMEERSPTPLPAIARRDEHQFGSAAVQRMELFVLRALRWRMCSVTPFSFLCYFAHKFFDKGYVSDHLLLRAAQFIFVTIKGGSFGVMNLAVTAASSIAAAAVFAAADGSLTRDLIESKVTSIVDSLPEPLDPEGVFSCYSVMIQEACKEEPKPSKELDSSLSNPPEANHATMMILLLLIRGERHFMDGNLMVILDYSYKLKSSKN